MTTDFDIHTSTTVPSNYSWDIGTPDNILRVPAYLLTSYTSGYAPGLFVQFHSTSIPTTSAPVGSQTYFEWDFGDYYNDDTNIVRVTHPDHYIEHVYIMPGIYTVKLTQYNINFNQEYIEDGNPCIDAYDLLWYWDKLKSNAVDVKNRVTWNDASCTLNGRARRTWFPLSNCSQIHCKNWSWQDLRSVGKNPVKWESTFPFEPLSKKWKYEPPQPDCASISLTSTGFKFNQVTQILTKTCIKTYLVEVKEIAPKANACVVTVPNHGNSPLNIQITARYTTPGSFPIERIVWDFGDNTPLQTVTRYNIPSSEHFIYTGVFSSDPQDPRNYDAIHTYVRTANSFHSFFPSITAYSANTNTSSSCSTLVGPVNPYIPSSTPSSAGIMPGFRLLGARNNGNNVIYTVQAEEKIGFLISEDPYIPNNWNNNTVNTNTVPPNALCTGNCNAPIIYTGNTGVGFPSTTARISNNTPI